MTMVALSSKKSQSMAIAPDTQNGQVLGQRIFVPFLEKFPSKCLSVLQRFIFWRRIPAYYQSKKSQEG
jgi:hypothetical protein